MNITITTDQIIWFCTFIGALAALWKIVISRGLICECPEFVVEAGTAHAHQIAKHIYCKSRIVYIIFYILPYIGDKLPVDILRAVDAFVFMIILIVHIQTPVFASQKGAVDQQIGDGSF